MVLMTFTWPYGGLQVFISGTFSSWVRHYPMTLVDGSPMLFQVILDLPPGYHQYRFLVDGIWMCDERQPCMPNAYGAMSNYVSLSEPSVSSSTLQLKPYNPTKCVDTNDGIQLYTDASSGLMHLDSPTKFYDDDTDVSHSWICRLLSGQTVYDMLPLSNKVTIMDSQLPVKDAFQIMFEEGLFIIPIWDEAGAAFTGMLTASDFMNFLTMPQNMSLFEGNEKLYKCTVSDWKEACLRKRLIDRPTDMNKRTLIYVSEQDCLKDVAMKILQHEISSVPVMKSSTQDSPCMSILSIACLSGILRCIFNHLRESIGSLPLLQHPISNIHVGTWLPETGKGSGRQLVMLSHNALLGYAMELLLEARISSVPIVDENGALIDVFSRSDIMALIKNDMYLHIQPNQITMQLALLQLYQMNSSKPGRRPCYTCFGFNTLFQVMKQLCDPRVRRLVVVNAMNRRVKGIISLRDVLKLLLSL